MSSYTSTIIIITGHPGSGKTSIGKELSKELHIPLISKDAIKDRIFNDLGYSDKKWSLKVSAAAHRVMDYVISEELASGHALIVESNFKTDIDSERFRKLRDKYDSRIIQILVIAEPEIIFERFMNRPDRNDGHVEELDEGEIRNSFLEPYVPLDVDGELIRVDTTDFTNVDTAEITRKIKAAITG